MSSFSCGPCKSLLYFNPVTSPYIIRTDLHLVIRVLTIVVFIAGYITARFSLITQAIDLSYFAWDHGVLVRLFHESLGLKSLISPPVLQAHSCIGLESFRDGPQRVF